MNRAHGARRSLILVNLIDLTVSRFKHGGDLGELRCLRETSELVAGYCQIGAWSLEDIVVVNVEKLFIEVAVEWEWPSLGVEPIILSSLGPCNSCLIFLALRAVDAPVHMSDTFLLGFAVPRRAVDTDVEDHATPEGWEELLGEGFGEGLCRALRLGARIFLRDGLEGRLGAPAYV